VPAKAHRTGSRNPESGQQRSEEAFSAFPRFDRFLLFAVSLKKSIPAE